VSDDGDDDGGLLGDEEYKPSLGPDVPAVDIPEVDIPSTYEPGNSGDIEGVDADVDPAVSRVFWRLVLVFDVAFLALALGPMFIYFRGDWGTGGPAIALGAVAFVYGVREYREYRYGEG
jgi:hypothetical protein